MRLAMTSALSLPRPSRRRCSSANEGGRMNMDNAAGISLRTWAAPCQSISSRMSRPAAISASIQRCDVP
jgi:hypothetical protein